jgi:hypothetical protein
MTDKDKFFYWIAIGLMACALAYAFMATWVAIPESGKDHSNVILGFLLGSILGTIVGVIYGTSKTSQDRSEMQTRKDGGAVPPIIDPVTPIQQAQADKIVAEIEAPKVNGPNGPLK